MKDKKMLPMMLQFFAEEQGEPEQSQQTQQEPENAQEQQNNELDATPDNKALNEQLQSALVEIARLKRQVDKSSSEAAEFKKKYRESLSETEKASQEKAEAEARKQEEYESMKKTLRVNELTENFMDLGYEKALAKEAATAQVDGDTERLLTIQKQFQDKQRKQWEADFLKTRPEIASGMGNAPQLSKEDFDKMTLIEKTKLKRENEAEYKRLLAL